MPLLEVSHDFIEKLYEVKQVLNVPSQKATDIIERACDWIIEIGEDFKEALEIIFGIIEKQDIQMEEPKSVKKLLEFYKMHFGKCK